MKGISNLGVTAILFAALGSFIAAYIILQGLSGGVDPSKIPHGVYILVNDTFVPLNISGPFVPREPGYYFLYFHNDLCPHCQAFYPKWMSFLKSGGGVFRNITVIEIVCDWFTQQCRSDSARATFSLYQVSASPTFLLIKVGINGSIENIWDIGSEYAQLQSLGKIPSGQEYLPQYLEAIVRSKIAR